MVQTRSGRARSTLLLGSLTLALLVGCRGDDATVPAMATRVHTGPVASGTRAVEPGRPTALATWTLPPGAGPGAPPVDPGAVATEPAVAVPDGIPAPSPVTASLPPGGAPPPPDPAIAALLAGIDAERMMGDVRRLASFGTRHALSDPESPGRGIGAARRWLRSSFEEIGRTAAAGADRSRAQVQVEAEPFQLEAGGRRTDQENVIATLTGIGLRKRLVYAVAHYDSRGPKPEDGVGQAPGADDNASGVAALLEMARVLSGRQWDATLRFVASAAHETGTQGSRHHASRAGELGLPIAAVLDFDRIGAPAGEGPAALVYHAGGEEDRGARLARTVAAVAKRYGLDARIAGADEPEDHPGDHARFAAAGFPAARLAAASPLADTLHGPNDTPERLDPEALRGVTRLGLAVLAELALAPRGPEDAPRLERVAERDDALRVTWTAVEDEAVAGYWLVLRFPDGAREVELVWVGAAAEHTLEGVPGDVRVAVASADALGHMSLLGPEGRP